MVENVIQIVDAAPNFVTCSEWPCVAVRFIKSSVESTEQRRHRDIGFTVADIDSGIEDHSFAAHEHRRVAGPKIAMQQRWLRVAASQNGRQRAEQTIAIALQLAESVLRRERKLRRQSLLAKERAPVVGPTILLRRSSDPVVTHPAESLAVE